MTTDRSGLADFEGKQVLRSTVKVTNAGDGLSDSLNLDPVEYHQGDSGVLVIAYECTQVAFAPIDKDDPTGPQKRVHTFKAGTAFTMDDDVMAKALAEQRDKILTAKEEAAGIQRMKFDEPPAAPALSDAEAEAIAAQLAGLDKNYLRELCGSNSIEYAERATGKTLVKLLVPVPGIIDQATALLAGHEAAPDNVVAINGEPDSDG